MQAPFSDVVPAAAFGIFAMATLLINLRTGIFPNRVNLAGLVMAIAVLPLSGISAANALAGSLSALAALFSLSLVSPQGIGMGTVKTSAVFGLFIGLRILPATVAMLVLMLGQALVQRIRAGPHLTQDEWRRHSLTASPALQVAATLAAFYSPGSPGWIAGAICGVGLCAVSVRWMPISPPHSDDNVEYEREIPEEPAVSADGQWGAGPTAPASAEASTTEAPTSANDARGSESDLPLHRPTRGRRVDY